MLLKSPLHLVLIIFLSLLNCKGTTNNVIASNNEKKTMDFETLLVESQSNFEEQTTLKITNTETLKQVYSTINSTRKPGFPIPEVDFAKYDLVFFSLGLLPTGGHSLAVNAVNKNSNAIDIELRHTAPGPGDYAITVMTTPCILIKIDKTNLPVNIIF